MKDVGYKRFLMSSQQNDELNRYMVKLNTEDWTLSRLFKLLPRLKVKSHCLDINLLKIKWICVN